MAVITLTTEWRPDDFYSGIIKGRLCSLCPGITIIDNAFNLPPYNIPHAAFVIRNTFENYPKGSVHLIFIHSEAGSNGRQLLVGAREHYFIGTDNGIFNLILNSDPELVMDISDSGDNDEMELFARTASHLLAGKDLRQLGKPLSHFTEKVPLRATIDKDVIIGSIIFIDSYGNAISNITREVFSRVFENRKFRILIQSNKNYTEHISKRYSDEPVGELLTRFNSLDLLEISINGANVSELLSLSVGSAVRVDVRENKQSSNKLF